MNTPLLLLHGALGSATQFNQLLPLLPGDWPVFTLNFPGHGGRSSEPGFSIEQFSEAILTFLDRHKIKQVQIFGYSMGGYTAMHLASKQPDRVARIITLGTKFHWTPEIAAKEVALLNPEKIAVKVPVFAELLAERHAPTDWKELLRHTAGLLQELGNGAALRPETFRKINCPVLIGLGSEDHLVTVEESKEVAALLPNGRLDILPGVKHPFEQIDTALLVKWLTTNLSGNF